MGKYMTDTENEVLRACAIAVFKTIEKDIDGKNYANYNNFHYHLLNNEQVQALKTLAENL